MVVKPHTRTGKEASFYDDLPLQNADDISSVELCEWADAMIVIASSIIIEAMVLNKPVLYLKYLHANSTQYEESGACWTINSENDLEQAISSLKRDTTKVPYTSNQIDAFLHKIIYGDVNERDVLGDYQQHILTFRGPYQ